MMLDMSHVDLRFDGKTVLSDFNLSLEEGEHIALMGASGSGKTSILRLAAGLIKPTKGKITRGASRISMQFQEARLLPDRTAAENVNVVLSDKRDTLDEAREWLGRVGLADAADLYPDELSGGMAQRVALARVLAYRGDLLLLDEPFRGLDTTTREAIMELVATETRDRAVILVTHDEWEAQQLADRILTL